MPKGDDYEGPVRVTVDRPKTDGFPHIIDPFKHLSSADYKKLKAKYQKMADDRRDQRKAVQAELADVGFPDTSEDPFDDPIDDTKYKILKTLKRVNGQIRFLLRRKEWFYG